MNINMSDYFETGTKVMMGKDRGFKLRDKFHLDCVDKTGEIVNVKINDEIQTFTSSLFIGLFGESVRSLGEEKFRERYLFACKDEIRGSIEVGIQDAQKEEMWKEFRKKKPWQRMIRVGIASLFTRYVFNKDDAQNND